MHPVPLSQREQWPLTPSRLCLEQRPGVVCAGEGSKPLWGMKQGATTLATARGATRHPSKETEERGSPIPLPLGFLPPA